MAVTGRAETVGRPNYYGTTNEFLKQFEFESLKDLPKIEDLEGAIFEAEEPPVFAGVVGQMSLEEFAAEKTEESVGETPDDTANEPSVESIDEDNE